MTPSARIPGLTPATARRSLPPSGRATDAAGSTATEAPRKRVTRKPAKARLLAAIQDECERQRDALSKMEAASAQAMLLEILLGELLSSADFVVVLKSAGFASIPSLVRQRLLGQSPHDRAVPPTSETGSDSPRMQQDGRTDVRVDASVLLAGHTLPARTIRALGRMTSSRRSAVVAVMKSVDNFTGDFACALLAATPANEITDVVQAHRSDARRTRNFARSEKRLIDLHAHNLVLSVRHGDNLVCLAVYTSLVRSWIRSEDVLTWLRARYPDHAASLEQTVQAANDAKAPGRPMKLPYPRDGTAGSTKSLV